MLMLSGKKKVDLDFYDHVYYATTFAKGMQVGCVHRPDLAAPKEWSSLCYDGNDAKFYELYENMWNSEPYYSRLREICERSESGEAIQLIFWEDDKNDGERPILYKVIRRLFPNIKVQIE